MDCRCWRTMSTPQEVIRASMTQQQELHATLSQKHALLPTLQQNEINVCVKPGLVFSNGAVHMRTVTLPSIHPPCLLVERT